MDSDKIGATSADDAEMRTCTGNRGVAWVMVVALGGLAGGATAEERSVPHGYLFFTPRPRIATRDAVAEYSALQALGSGHHRQTNYSAESVDPKNAAVVSPVPQAAHQPEPATGYSAQPDYSAQNGFGYFFPGYTWMGSNYSAFSYGTPLDWPMCGLRYSYIWCGKRYSSHCFTRCDRMGNGPRYDCGFRPCWNDAGPTVFESRNERGSYLDCFWQMGGWDCYHTPSCCTYPCSPGYCWPGSVASTRVTPSQKVPTNYYDYNFSGSTGVPELTKPMPSTEMLAPTPYMPHPPRAPETLPPATPNEEPKPGLVP